MQKLQNRSQPSITVTNARPGVAGSEIGVALREDRSARAERLSSRARARAVPRLGRLDQRGHEAQVVRAEDEVDRGEAAQQIASPSCCATQPADAEHAAGALLLPHAQPPEIAVEALLGLVADRAGIHDQEVRVVGLRDRAVPLAAEQRGDLLRVERVHLAAIGADVEAAARGQRKPREGRPRNLPESRPESARRARDRVRVGCAKENLFICFYRRFHTHKELDSGPLYGPRRRNEPRIEIAFDKRRTADDNAFQIPFVWSGGGSGISHEMSNLSPPIIHPPPLPPLKRPAEQSAGRSLFARGVICVRWTVRCLGSVRTAD